MPRMANDGPEVSLWYESARSEGSSTFDLCKRCAKRYAGQPLPRGCEPYHAGEPRGVLEEMESCPDIEDWDRSCDVCNTRLRDDNYYTE